MTADIIAMCNRKGGVGKSTNLYHLIRAAILAGKRVLAVDGDPQGNLTSRLTAIEVAPDRASVADVLSPRVNASIRSIIVRGIWPGLDVAPTVARTLDVVERQLVIANAIASGEVAPTAKYGKLPAGWRPRQRLREALAEVADDYDIIFIDCPPATGEITTSALVAAGGVVPMTEAGGWSADGLNYLLDSIDEVREQYNADLRILGVLLNNYEFSTISDNFWLQKIGEALASRNPPIPVLDPPMRHMKRIKETVDAGKGLDEWPIDRPLSRYLASVYSGYLTTMEKGLK
jgi:chromosome partitioning protein